jgi:hypothetical protein
VVVCRISEPTSNGQLVRSNPSMTDVFVRSSSAKDLAYVIKSSSAPILCQHRGPAGESLATESRERDHGERELIERKLGEENDMGG